VKQHYFASFHHVRVDNAKKFSSKPDFSIVKQLNTALLSDMYVSGDQQRMRSVSDFFLLSIGVFKFDPVSALTMLVWQQPSHMVQIICHSSTKKVPLKLLYQY